MLDTRLFYGCVGWWLVDKNVLYSYFSIPCGFTQSTNYFTKSTNSCAAAIFQSIKSGSKVCDFLVIITTKMLSKFVNIQIMLFQDWLKVNSILVANISKHFFNIAHFYLSVYIDTVQKCVYTPYNSKLADSKFNASFRKVGVTYD